MEEKDKNRRSDFRKRLVVTLAVVFSIIVCMFIVVLILFKQVPKSYVRSAVPEPNASIPQFVIRDIVATIYNESQLAEPFDLAVSQDEMNEIITNKAVTGLAWPVEVNGVTISSPAIIFEPETLSIMATVNYAGFPVVATFMAEPKLQADGMLYLNISTVKAGVMNITPLATKLASGIFANQSEKFPDEPFITMLAGACLENKPIEPVFAAFDRQIRIISADIQSEKLILRCKREDPKKLTTQLP